MIPSVEERPQWYVKRFPNSALVAQASLNPELQLDSDAPFRATGVAVYVFDSTGAAIGAAGGVGLKLRFARPDGVWIQKRLITAQAVNPFDADAAGGAGGQPAAFFSYFSPFGVNVFYPASSSIQIDLQLQPAVSDQLVMVVFCGVKMYTPGAVWKPEYPSTARVRPYNGYNLQPVIPSANVPLTIAPDAGFVWRAGGQAPGGTRGFGGLTTRRLPGFFTLKSSFRNSRLCTSILRICPSALSSIIPEFSGRLRHRRFSAG